jgi:hypothetical protein
MTPDEYKRLLKEALLVNALELIVMQGIDDRRYLPTISDFGTKFEVQMPESLPINEEE